MATKRYSAGPRHSITSPVKVHSMRPSSKMWPRVGDAAPCRKWSVPRQDAHAHAAWGASGRRGPASVGVRLLTLQTGASPNIELQTSQTAPESNDRESHYSK